MIRHINEGADYYTITAKFKIHNVIQIMRFKKSTNRQHFWHISFFCVFFLLAYFSKMFFIRKRSKYSAVQRSVRYGLLILVHTFGFHIRVLFIYTPSTLTIVCTRLAELAVFWLFELNHQIDFRNWSTQPILLNTSELIDRLKIEHNASLEWLLNFMNWWHSNVYIERLCVGWFIIELTIRLLNRLKSHTKLHTTNRSI